MRRAAAVEIGRADELLGELGLSDRANNIPEKLSGGERQRVAIARALANGPSILLADEPTGSLDAAAADSVMELFTRIRSQRKLTILLVTHDPRVADHADRIIQMRAGRVFVSEEARGDTTALPGEA